MGNIVGEWKANVKRNPLAVVVSLRETKTDEPLRTQRYTKENAETESRFFLQFRGWFRVCSPFQTDPLPGLRASGCVERRLASCF
jgi:hypothetical protein